MASLFSEIRSIWQTSGKGTRALIVALVLLYPALFLAGGFVLDNGLWRFYQAVYAEARIEIDGLHATGTALASTITAFPAPPTPTSQTAIDTPVPLPGTPTPEPSPTAPPVPTPTTPPTLTLSPSGLANGTCDVANPPCIYYNAESWEELTTFLFSAPEECRWPEIADLNRKPNGHYYVPLPEGSALMVASPGTFSPLVTENDGVWEQIPSCQTSTQKPCLMTVPSGIHGSQLQAYALLAEIAYGRSDDIFALAISQANLASDCHGNPRALSPGITVVIPDQ